MKFKTFFQRRPAASMAESDEMPASTTKRKKKETKALTLTPSIKSATGAKNTFIKTAPKEKKVACTTAEIQVNTSQRSQPQPDDDESVDCIRYSCDENCGGRENPKVPLLGDVAMKLTDDELPQKCDNMELENAKMDLEEHKVLLLKAQDQIKELTDEMDKMKASNEEKDKEFVKLHEDFLLCIRGSERFRYEAEKKAEELELEVDKLKEELHELKSNKKHEFNGGVNNGSSALKFTSVSEQSTVAASSMEQKPKDREAMGVKKLVLPGRDTLNPEKVEDALNESMNKRRDEKLAILRKNCRGSLRNGLLNWCKTRTQGYSNVEITNFSTSWTNGLALAALIHSLNRDAFDYNALKPSCPIDNFKTALKAAEKYGVSGHLNAINLIVESENPPWEPIVAYVTEVYLSAPN